MTSSDKIQKLYDEWRAAEAVLSQKRDEHYKAADDRNAAKMALHEEVVPGDEYVVAHDDDHKARITAEYLRAMPGHRMSIEIEGQQGERMPLQFGSIPEGEKVTRKKI